jgi:soluble lytic murein transglycosylase-like protein
MSPHARDLLLAHRAKRAGANYNLRIILEARRAGLPISLAFAVVEQESGFKNIFGCDKGGPFCHHPVSRTLVQQLLAHVRAGGTSNGVGLTQLTWIGYLNMAERRGGAHIPKNQLSVGFEALAAHIAAHGTQGGLAAYNAGYAREVLEKQARWHKILT